jgi:predicted RNase H-like HicB family nuclease
MRYFGLIDGTEGAYGIYFPDCAGCTAMGSTADEAVTHAIEALAEWLEDHGAPFPQPSTIEVLRALPDVNEALQAGASFIQIPALLEKARPVKANISLSHGLLEALDEAAARLTLTRSAFIAAAVREKINTTY